jgi:hypothetical protein
VSEFGVAVAWVNQSQLKDFLEAWSIGQEIPPWLFLIQDEKHEGGSITKNRAIRAAVDCGSEVVVVLDDDCYPSTPGQTLPEFCQQHIEALSPQPVRMFEVVTDPPSRGTPYDTLDVKMPVAASMGFWTGVGDYCGPRQLAFGATHPMTFSRKTIFGRYFPLCGMNYAFRPRGWHPWFYLVEGVGRFDDIWMGFLWQHEAYRKHYCFNLAGPMVHHVRQSNVWKNLQDETRMLKDNETVWASLEAITDNSSYYELREMLPRPRA